MVGNEMALGILENPLIISMLLNVIQIRMIGDISLRGRPEATILLR